MSKTNTFENEFLLLVFNNASITLIGDAAGLLKSAADGSLFVSLHTSDPGEAATQLTNEIAYGTYARVGVIRTSAGWTVVTNTVDNTALVTFSQRTNTGSDTATHFGVGASSTGAGKLLYSGALDSNLVITQNITPEFAIGACNMTED